MNEQKLNNKETAINPNKNKGQIDCLVGLPPLQLNEIYNDDSFELCKRVPAKTVDLISWKICRIIQQRANGMLK